MTTHSWVLILLVVAAILFIIASWADHNGLESTWRALIALGLAFLSIALFLKELPR